METPKPQPVVLISIDFETRESPEKVMEMALDYLAEEFAKKLRALIDENSNVVNVKVRDNKVTLSVKLLTSHLKRKEGIA